MFGYFSNSIGFGQRESIKATITRDNLTATVTATCIWYDFSSTGTGYSAVPTTAVNGTSLTSITDLSGKGRNGTPASVSYATNQAVSLGAAKFPGSTSYIKVAGMTTYLGSVKGMTAVLAVKTITSATTAYICGTDQSDLQIYFSSGKWNVKFGAATAASTINVMTTNTWQLHSFVFDGNGANNNSRLRYRYNKADQGLTITGTVPATANASNDNFAFGATDFPGSNVYTGYIGECFLWNRALTVGEVAAIETYLGTKWGI